MMYEFPIKYFEENLIFNRSNKECWACYRIVGQNYDYLSNDRKMILLNKISRFIAAIGVEAQILIIPVAQDIRQHYSRLLSTLDPSDRLYEYAKAHAAGVESYLMEKIKRDGNSNEYNCYVLTKLAKTNSAKQLLDQLIKRPLKTIEELFSVDDKEILQSEIQSFLETANTWFREQDKRLRLERTDARTTQWLIRRCFRRGISEEVKLRENRDGSTWQPYGTPTLKDGEEAVRPYERDVLSLTESNVEVKNRHLKITGSDGQVSYQTYLTVAHIPDGLVFPGSEWLLLLQDYPITTEVCIHISAIEFREASKKISGKRREIKSQIEHVAENDNVPDELYEASASADELEAELKRARDPLTMTSISICVSSTDEKEMEAKAAFIKERYEDMTFVFERPFTDQFKLFMEFLPGAGRYVKDYIIPLPPQTIAGSMFPVSRILGDNQGPVIGTTGILEKMVSLDMSEACQRNRSASALLIGTLGGGKSFNANLLVYLAVLYGGSALIFDPKGERGIWKETIPELSDAMSVTTLSADDEDAGKLDPFLIYRNDLNAAGELAQNILCELFKVQPRDDEFTAILEAIKETKEDQNPCMSTLADKLENFKENDELRGVAKKLSRRIRLIRQGGMAKLLFGTGNERGLSFKNRLNILQIQNLQMPDPETPKEDYTLEETLSTVLMLPIASFAMEFAKSDRSVFKIILFDESWALTSTQMGIKMMNAMARMGRSLNAGCIFIGHSINDLRGDGIKNAITYKFCFKTTEIHEIKRVLSFLDLEETDENIKAVSNLGNGECLFQDLEGRVGRLKFDAIYSHLISAFNTTPGGSEGKKAET